jgi:hypothetical protein
VTPVLGTDWSGAQSQQSNVVSADPTPPVNAISLSAVTGNAVSDGDTVFYRSLAAGSFTLTNAVSDPGSGPASSTTASLAGTSTGWTHDPSSVSAPPAGPYVSNPFSWAAASGSAPSEVVTGRDLAGNATATTLALVNDSTAPSAGSIGYPDGYQPARSVLVTFTSGTDAGSGIATSQLQRSSAALSGATCATFTGFADVGPAEPTSPYTDNQVPDGSCQQYRYVVTDRVSNQDTATSTTVAKVSSAAARPALRTAGTYSVLAGTGVANTGPTSLSGDLGVSPSSAITGFPAGTVAGTIHAGDPAAAQAQADLVLAYNDAAARTETDTFAGDMTGHTFDAGVHHTAAAFALTGNLTLDGQGDPNAVFIFQVNAGLNTAASSTVTLINGAQASHVFWQVNGAAGTDASSAFAGTIMSAGAITLGAGSTLAGRPLCYGTATLASNTVTTD